MRRDTPHKSSVIMLIVVVKSYMMRLLCSEDVIRVTRDLHAA